MTPAPTMSVAAKIAVKGLPWASSFMVLSMPEARLKAPSNTNDGSGWSPYA